MDGFWGEWTTWTECTQTCDLGQRERSRQCQYNDTAPHGAPCPTTDAASERAICNLDWCPGIVHLHVVKVHY